MAEKYWNHSGANSFNSPDKDFGGATFGGYSERIVTNEDYVLHVPDGLDLAAAAPFFIELIKMQDINQAYERLLKGGVKYRFVIDMATLKN